LKDQNMTTIHAFLRAKPITVELFEALVEFKPNEKGHIVADVSEKRIVDRLLSIAEGYKVYGAVALPNGDDDEDVIETSPYVLTQEGDGGEEVTIDLRTLALAALEAFCAENEIPLPQYKPRATAKAKEATLRDAIVEFFKVE
jgi:hypothetical protein